MKQTNTAVQPPLTDLQIRVINAKLRYAGYDELYPDQLLAAKDGGENTSNLLEEIFGRLCISENGFPR